MIHIIKRGYFFVLLIFFSCGKNTKPDYFNLNDEITNSQGNSNELKKIVEREKQKFLFSQNLSTELSYRYAESFLIDNNRIDKISKLYEIILKNNNKYEPITLLCDYHIAEELQQSSPILALEFIDEAIEIEKKNKSTKFLPHLYHLKGKYYYQKEDHNNAILYYLKAFEVFRKQKNITYKASMYNNIGLCYDGMGQYSKSEKYFETALSLANQENIKNKDLFFINNILLNVAQSNFKQKKYTKSEEIFEKFFNDYYLQKKYDFIYISFADRLIDIYINTNQNNKIKELINKVNENTYTDLKEQIVYHRVITKYYIYTNQQTLAQKYLLELFIKEDRLKKGKNLEINNLNAQFEEKILRNLKEENKLEIEKMRNKNIAIAFFLLSILITLAYLFWVDKMKTKNKKKLIEKENHLHKERIRNQKLLLEIKNNAEQKLLQKIKDLRKKNKELPTSVEDLIKEIFLNINNIVEINKRNTELIGEDFNKKEENLNKIKQNFPQLTDLEVRLCNYYDLKLSSKEISLLENLTEGTIRVYRNKIKKKLELKPNEDLATFIYRNIHV